MNIFELVEKLYQEHAKFYDYPVQHDIKEFVYIQNSQDTSKLLVVQNHESLDIRLEISHEVAKLLEKTNPLKNLNQDNLNSFWILSEETSHFATLVERAKNKQAVRRYELERQAEIDKVLLASIRLYEQHKDPHYRELIHLLFNCSTFTSSEPHYRDAHDYAARFWQDIVTKNGMIPDPLHSPILKAHLRQIFYGELEKHKLIA